MAGPLKGGGGKGLSTKEKNNFWVFLLVMVLLITKPGGGGTNGLIGLSTKTKNFPASLRKTQNGYLQTIENIHLINKTASVRVVR